MLLTFGFHMVYHRSSVCKPTCWATIGYKNSKKVLQKSKLAILKEVTKMFFRRDKVGFLESIHCEKTLDINFIK